MTHDSDLVRRAETKATGADVHDVNQWCSNYVIAFRYSKSERADANNWKKLADRSERILRAFVGHGDIKRAVREIPASDAPPGDEVTQP